MSDKRSVSTDALATLGSIIDHTQKRDAIHLAVEPVTAGEAFYAGAHVNVVNGVAYAAEEGEGMGIVDPFLTVDVVPGDIFWFVMYPRQVTSLRHVWSHPAFPDEINAAHAPTEVEVTDSVDKDMLTAITYDREELMAVTPVVLEKTPYIDSIDKVVSERWIRAYAERLDVGYRDLIESAQHYLENDEYMVRGGILEGVTTPDEFWDHYEVVTGKTVPIGKRDNFFSCAC